MADMMEEVTYCTVSSVHPMFHGRCNEVKVFHSGQWITIARDEMPDTLVLCNGCNRNQFPNNVEAVFFGGRLHDVYCPACREQYFPHAIHHQEAV